MHGYKSQRRRGSAFSSHQLVQTPLVQTPRVGAADGLEFIMSSPSPRMPPRLQALLDSATHGDHMKLLEKAASALEPVAARAALALNPVTLQLMKAQQKVGDQKIPNLGILDGLKQRILDSFQRVYLESVKPSLTSGDKHMPMAVRRVIHEVADAFWLQLMQELPDTIDSWVDKAKARRRQQRKKARYVPMLHLLDEDDKSPRESSSPGVGSGSAPLVQPLGPSAALPAVPQERLHVSLMLQCSLEDYAPESLASGLALFCGVPPSAVVVGFADDAAWTAESTYMPVVAIVSVPRGEAGAVEVRLSDVSAGEMSSAVGHRLSHNMAPTVEIELEIEHDSGASSDEEETAGDGSPSRGGAPPTADDDDPNGDSRGGNLFVAILGECVQRLRVFLLYHFLPFDQTIFGRLSTYKGVLIQLIASFPILLIRALFFSLLLVCMLPELDEFLLMKYILLLKGSQAFAGVLHAIIGIGELWYCAVVTQPSVCAKHAPGAGESWLPGAAVNVWLQLLVYAAFVLLPLARRRDEEAKAARAAAAAAAAATAARLTEGDEARDSGRLSAASADQHAAAGSTASAGTAVFTGAQPVTDPQQTAGAAPTLPASPSSLPTSPAGADGTTPTSRSSWHGGRGYSVLPEGDASTSSAPTTRKLWEELDVAASALLRDVRSGKYNLILPLLKYDAMCFVGAWALFAAGVALTAANHADGGAVDVGGAAWLWLLLQPATWWSWRAGVTHYVFLRVAFPLSAAPFMAFMIPAIDKLLSRTAATGYDHDGHPVPLETNGVSAYVSWLELFIVRPPARQHLTEAEIALLRKACVQARAHLRRYPHEDSAMKARRRAELDGLLTTIVPPSHALYASVFPDRMLCKKFEERLLTRDEGLLAPKKAQQLKTGAQKARKYGISWQADSAARGCTICGLSWTLSRWRHHCRTCGQLVCDACSQSRLTVPTADGAERQNKRVCDNCREVQSLRSASVGSAAEAASPSEAGSPSEAEPPSSRGRY